jgi:ubiquinone/menaquinone biosynthesis C-methylase UbiE
MAGDLRLSDLDEAEIVEKRLKWERRYHRQQGDDFDWYLPHPPNELVQLLEDNRVPIGPALDLGCGTGVVTSFLYARSFRPSVGLDFAYSALSQARAVADRERTEPRFVQAAAPRLPFAAESFMFVFDRGCLQALPNSARPLYFHELDRVLKPQGVLQLFAKNLPPSSVYRLIPISWQSLTVTEFPFRLKDGTVRQITLAAFRKTR